MLSYHSRVLTVRFDLHLHSPTVDNRCVSCFFRKLRKTLKRRYALSRLGFIWCREQGRGEAQHYHCGVFIDGHQVKYPVKVLGIVDDIWQGWGHPKPYTPANCYLLVKRGDPRTMRKALSRLSYLAKVYSKGQRLPSVNDYSSSRIKARRD